MKFTAKPHKFM